MEELSLRETAVPLANRDTSFVMKQYGKFIALAFGVSWLIWISALRLGKLRKDDVLWSDYEVVKGFQHFGFSLPLLDPG